MMKDELRTRFDQDDALDFIEKKEQERCRKRSHREKKKKVFLKNDRREIIR